MRSKQIRQVLHAAAVLPVDESTAVGRPMSSAPQLEPEIFPKCAQTVLKGLRTELNSLSSIIIVLNMSKFTEFGVDSDRNTKMACAVLDPPFTARRARGGADWFSKRGGRPGDLSVRLGRETRGETTRNRAAPRSKHDH